MPSAFPSLKKLISHLLLTRNAHTFMCTCSLIAFFKSRFCRVRTSASLRGQHGSGKSFISCFTKHHCRYNRPRAENPLGCPVAQLPGEPLPGTANYAQGLASTCPDTLPSSSSALSSHSPINSHSSEQSGLVTCPEFRSELPLPLSPAGLLVGKED